MLMPIDISKKFDNPQLRPSTRGSCCSRPSNGNIDKLYSIKNNKNPEKYPKIVIPFLLLSV